MKTSDVFSLAVIIKDLGVVMVAAINSAQSIGIHEFESSSLESIINQYWERYSLLSGLEFNVIPDMSQVEGYEILVHKIGDPHILVSVNFNLS